MKTFENFGDINRKSLEDEDFSKETIESIINCLDIDYSEEEIKYKNSRVRILNFNSSEYPRNAKRDIKSSTFFIYKREWEF